MYELVSAVIRRSEQITEVRAAYNPSTLEEQQFPILPPSLEQQSNEKSTTLAFQEILSDEVTYRFHSDDE